MRIAFVGVSRKYKELDPEYRDFFNRYHLEIPFYYARDGINDVTITTVDHDDAIMYFENGGSLRCVKESTYISDTSYEYDAVIHFRRWCPELYKKNAINLMVSQDHSFDEKWLSNVRTAWKDNKLYGCLVFAGWHKANTHREIRDIPLERFYDNVILGVDTETYKPTTFPKDAYNMLWSSDPGRGLRGAIELVTKLFRRDRRFRLHICHPDYVKGMSPIIHPAIVWHGNVPNGPSLWKLFNETTGILPYTSTFPEPSSRSHRQAMAAGSLVLYPPSMGSPSDLIQNKITGIVEDVAKWPDIIIDTIKNGDNNKIGMGARQYCLSENWATQARRFNELIDKIKETKACEELTRIAQNDGFYE